MDKRIYCADVEGDNLLSDITKLYCASWQQVDETGKEISKPFTLTEMKEIAEMYADPNNILIMHNGVGYDGPAVEKVLKIKVEAEIIDTLYLSWYLYPKEIKHGLAYWGETLGIAKPEIDDWTNLDIEDYVHRCEEDVRIQTALWQQMWKHLMLLYKNSNAVWRMARHLSFKAKVLQMQEKSRWKLDVSGTEAAYDMFEQKFLEAKSALEERMPDNPIYKKKSRPAKPFKVNGDMSAHGIKWKDFCLEHGIDFDSREEHKYIAGYKDPNAGSSTQLKSWLNKLGWVPESFKYVRDKETNEQRVVPQVKNQETEELCESIVKLIDKEPALEHLKEMSIVKHRMSVVNGFLKNCDDEGYIYAANQGLTNTLRLKHKICVNIPSTRKPYGKLIRGLLTTRSKNFELCGSDMSSLEDRTKQHYMWKHDPEYVTDMMQPGFDPHCDMALAANLMTNDDVKFYKSFDKENSNDEEYAKHSKLALIRHAGKGTNYAATYGATGPTIARAAGVDESVGDILHEAYWSRNWSLIAIAEECMVKNSRGMKWLWNPVAKMWFYLKAEKDRFSTLNQGTGTYAFDRWVYYIVEQRPQITAQFHDEVILELKKGNQDAMTDILKKAICQVNDELKLNRKLDCDVDFGKSYAEIH